MSSKALPLATLAAGLALAMAAGSTSAETPAAPPPADARSTIVQPTANGDVIVRTSMPEQKPAGPPPAFALLDQRQRGYLDEEDARGYPPLATDFVHADANRDGRVSKDEYQRWATRP